MIAIVTKPPGCSALIASVSSPSRRSVRTVRAVPDVDEHAPPRRHQDASRGRLQDAPSLAGRTTQARVLDVRGVRKSITPGLPSRPGSAIVESLSDPDEAFHAAIFAPFVMHSGHRELFA